MLSRFSYLDYRLPDGTDEDKNKRLSGKEGQKGYFRSDRSVKVDINEIAMIIPLTYSKNFSAVYLKGSNTYFYVEEETAIKMEQQRNYQHGK